MAVVSYHVDIVDQGKMAFEIATPFGFVLAHVAIKPLGSYFCFEIGVEWLVDVAALHIYNSSCLQ